MSTLINDDTLHDSITIEKRTGTTVTFGTKEKYIEKNIQLDIEVKRGSINSIDIRNPYVTPSISFDPNSGVVTASNNHIANLLVDVTSGYVSGAITSQREITGSSTYTIPIATVSETRAYLGIS